MGRFSQLLNVGEAADYIGVSAASLRKWSDQGLVSVYRTPGGQRRFVPGDLDEFMSSMRQGAEAERNGEAAGGRHGG